MEKQNLYEKADRQLAEAYRIIEETSQARESFGSLEEELKASKSQWLVEKQRIYEKADKQLALAHKIVNQVEEAKNVTNDQWLVERQNLYERTDGLLAKANKIILDVEEKAQNDKTEWLVEKQNIYEKSDRDMAAIFEIVTKVEMDLKVEIIKLQECEESLESYQKKLANEQGIATSLRQQLENITSASNEISIQKVSATRKPDESRNYLTLSKKSRVRTTKQRKRKSRYSRTRSRLLDELKLPLHARSS